MPYDQLLERVNHVPVAALDAVSRDMWRALGEGTLTEAQAQALAEAVHARRKPHLEASAPPECLRVAPIQAPSGMALEALGAPAVKLPRLWSYFPPKSPQRSPDKAKSLERRRTLAASGPMPPQLACRFTTGELAVLKIVADAVVAERQCTLSIPEIAARAGVGRTKVRMSLKIAQDLGLVSITERRVNYHPNLPNVVRIVSQAWLAWVARWKPRSTVPRKTDREGPGPVRPPGPSGRQGEGGEGSLLRRPRNQRFTRKAGG